MTLSLSFAQYLQYHNLQLVSFQLFDPGPGRKEDIPFQLIRPHTLHYIYNRVDPFVANSATKLQNTWDNQTERIGLLSLISIDTVFLPTANNNRKI